MFEDASLLVTGGTGSFGHAFVREVLRTQNPRRLIVYSRDELKQYEMQQEFRQDEMRFFMNAAQAVLKEGL